MYVTSFKKLNSIDYSNSASVLYNAVQIFWIKTFSLSFFGPFSYFFFLSTNGALQLVLCWDALGDKIAWR